MKRIILIASIVSISAVCGCTAEKSAPPVQQLQPVSLSVADKEKLVAFQKDILDIEALTDKAIKFAGDELMNVIKGGAVSISLPSVIEKTKFECLLAGETLVKKTIPETLPPEMKTMLNEGRAGLVSAYKTYAESFEAIRSFITDKNPMALLEYQKKSSQAKELYSNAANKFSVIMTAAGVTK